ncbi:hypothetical protein PDE_06218 [Penicillium oxalicum 114-2]|uniref:Protein kinase domain-containing protein n=1 Tax=Penicillium oxalicum (strain 114-2 / CGMCC 5302) TaxID=933388 RepID=S8AY25_PENO1|nr:hypothetical protein PDE_06218 [Penicillium oxalicum 114-2]
MNKEVYHAVLKIYYSSPSDVRPELLEKVIWVPKSAFNPPFLPKFTRAPEPLPVSSYIRKPQLICYDRICQGPQPNLIADSVLIEAEIVPDGRITGLCFVKYPYTLTQEVSPGSLTKRKLRRARQATKDYSRILPGIEDGIKHLHSLGLVHNDINPSNIMLDGDRAVFIDFGSCRKLGQSLKGVGCTYEWYDEQVQQSVFENDLNALEEIRIWLGDDSRKFQFDE